ncbi:MAG: DUF1257 domain-containing protein [Planctomycetia bacterium]
MSGVLVVTPLVIANWPLIVQAVAGVVGVMGLSVLPETEIQIRAAEKARNRAELELDESEIQGTGVEELVLEKDGCTIRVTRDMTGQLKLCVEGPLPKVELHALGEKIMGAITQQYVYHRIMSELEERGVSVLSEEMTEDHTVKLRVQAW